MKMRSLSLDKSKCWPVDDTYFLVGISACVNLLKYNETTCGYLFVNLNSYSLIKFMNTINTFKDERIVIISTMQLMPLADYWLTSNTGVFAVFESRTSVDTIIDLLNTSRIGGNIPRQRINTKKRLSRYEFNLLQHYLNNGVIDKFQDEKKKAYSTIQYWKKCIALKLNVRKLEHLLLHI